MVVLHPELAVVEQPQLVDAIAIDVQGDAPLAPDNPIRNPWRGGDTEGHLGGQFGLERPRDPRPFSPRRSRMGAGWRPLGGWASHGYSEG
jgi:hypothetical protein